MIKKITYVSMFSLLLFSCSKDDSFSFEDLSGTWVLSAVNGDCSGIPIQSSANDSGCFDLPVIEVNCSVIALNADGTLDYAYNFTPGTGTYSIDGNTINICTDRCLDYTFDGTQLTLQTGTVELCDPTYTYTRSSSSLNDILDSNQKLISRVLLNGQVSRIYNYNADNSIQQIQIFNEDGNLNQTTTFTFELMRSILDVTLVEPNVQSRYIYFDEAPNRTRRDWFNEAGDLLGYRFYFHDDNTCWVDRVEDYTAEDELRFLRNYNYNGPNCSRELIVFRDGQKAETVTSQFDDKPYWGTASLLNILKYHETSNILSTSYVRDGIVNENLTYNSVFTYDASGWPITETRTYADGAVELYTYEYK